MTKFHVHGQRMNVISVWHSFRDTIPIAIAIQAKNNGSEIFLYILISLFIRNVTETQSGKKEHTKKKQHIHERRKRHKTLIAFTILIPSAQMKRKELLLNTWKKKIPKKTRIGSFI